MISERMHKIAIIGAGQVGATVAYACLMQGLGRQIVLFDANRTKVEAEVLDLNHGLQYMQASTIEGSDDLGICADADVVVFAAGARPKAGKNGIELASANAKICESLLPEILRVAPAAILLMITSPVDVMTYAAWKYSGLSPRRVLGSGTVLDSSRFRMLIAERCRVAARDVSAWIAGEHGNNEVPLWSSASIANVPLHQWAVAGHGKLTVRDRTEIFQAVRQASQYVIAGKGATNYAIGLATAEIISAILCNDNRVLSVSSVLEDYHGITDICLSVPSIVNRGGVDVPLPVPLNQAEELGLQNSAQSVRAVLEGLGLAGADSMKNEK